MDNQHLNEMQPESFILETVQEQKLFVYESFSISYVNTFQVCCLKNEEKKDVRVDNYLCYQEGNTFFKVTEVYYEDKIVRIEDKFQVKQLNRKKKFSDQKQLKPKMIKNKDRVRIFCPDVVQKLESNGKVEKKDKKNIVKNVVKIFVAWIEKKKIDKGLSEFEEVQDEMKKLINEQKFNNRMIKEMVSSKTINTKFLHFLIDDAQEEVKYSRINDKQSHYEAIQLYTKLLQKEGESKAEIKNEGEGKSTEKEENKM